MSCATDFIDLIGAFSMIAGALTRAPRRADTMMRAMHAKSAGGVPRGAMKGRLWGGFTQMDAHVPTIANVLRHRFQKAMKKG